jgi:hypothetical protein
MGAKFFMGIKIFDYKVKMNQIGIVAFGHFVSD